MFAFDYWWQPWHPIRMFTDEWSCQDQCKINQLRQKAWPCQPFIQVLFIYYEYADMYSISTVAMIITQDFPWMTS